MKLEVNGVNREVRSGPLATLMHVLRDELTITGPKAGCQAGGCGACTVLVDGEAVLSCLLPVQEAEVRSIVTVEGLAEGPRPSALQEAFDLTGAAQCGFCTPGMLTRAYRFLQENPNPTEEEIRWGMSGNLCRCAGYEQITKAVLAAAKGAMQ